MTDASPCRLPRGARACRSRDRVRGPQARRADPTADRGRGLRRAAGVDADEARRRPRRRALPRLRRARAQCDLVPQHDDRSRQHGQVGPRDPRRALAEQPAPPARGGPSGQPVHAAARQVQGLGQRGRHAALPAHRVPREARAPALPAARATRAALPGRAVADTRARERRQTAAVVHARAAPHEPLRFLPSGKVYEGGSDPSPASTATSRSTTRSLPSRPSNATFSSSSTRTRCSGS